MPNTDRRLMEMFGKLEETENLNRILALLDNIAAHEFAIGDESALTAAIADATRLMSYLTADITLTGTALFSQAQEINGQDFKLTQETLSAEQYMLTQITKAGVTLREIDFNASGDSDGNTLYAVDVYAAESEISDNSFTLANAGSAGSVSVYYESYAGHKLNNNTMSNGVAFTGGCVMDEVKNNTFAATKGFGLGECTIGGIYYHEADPEKVAAIKEYLIAQGNVTTGGDLVVEGYYEA